MKRTLVGIIAIGLLGAVAEPSLASAAAGARPVFATLGADTLRTNLWVAEALLATAMDELLSVLPPPPAVILLAPASATDPATNLLTNVATNRLQRTGYLVHVDKTPAGTEDRVVELRYRVGSFELSYPRTGRRLGIWTNWVARQMLMTVQITVVEQADGQVLASLRLSRSFQDRVPYEHLAAVESTAYPFTRATPQASGWARRLEEIVVLGALAGLVAIYFANTE